MFTEAAFASAAAELARANGLTPDKAGEYLAFIGDTPERDGDRVVVRDEAGAVLARLIFPLEE